MNDDLLKSLNEFQNIINYEQMKAAEKAQQRAAKEIATISTASTLQAILEFMENEQQSRIKADKTNFWLNIIGLGLMAVTLAATIWFGLR